ncbi:hypothetical protein ABKN59_008034 [Abortiporus biennis]
MRRYVSPSSNSRHSCNTVFENGNSFTTLKRISSKRPLYSMVSRLADCKIKEREAKALPIPTGKGGERSRFRDATHHLIM